jgi:hypothetical protein
MDASTLNDLVRAQDERNRRLKATKAKQRKKMAEAGVSAFQCYACRREVKIPWSELRGAPPRCRECDGLLVLQVPLLNKGVLPRVQSR